MQFQHAVHAPRQCSCVRHQHEAGVVLAVECQHQFEHGGSRLFIEVAGGFVTEHAGRTIDQGTRHGGALAFAAGELAGLVLQAVAQADGLQQRPGALRSILYTGPVEQHRQHHVFQRGEFRQQVVELIDEAKRPVAECTACRIGQSAHLLATDVDFAGGGRVEPTQQVQQRALACAGGPQDRNGLALRHRQRQAIEHRRAQLAFRIGLAELLGVDHRIIHSAAPPPGPYVPPARPGTPLPGRPWSAPQPPSARHR